MSSHHFIKLYPLLTSIWNVGKLTIKDDSLESDYLPDPPTPRRITWPWGLFIIYAIQVT